MDLNTAQTKANCMIVDDDEIARLNIMSLVNKFPALHIAGVFDNAEEAFLAATANAPDVLLLDIDMPVLSGLQLREKLFHIPACIFITSYPDYAVEAFEKEALDFLVKPVNADRFARTVERLTAYLAVRNKAARFDSTPNDNSFYIKDGHDKIKIKLGDIVYLEALKDYTRIVTLTKRYCVLSLLGNLLKEKPFHTFMRIHRSYAVQKDYISKITATEVLVKDIALPVGRNYKEALAALK
ncbi:LytR/AlgR family response regulator transcription factor [Foetidibacter luteolus]|uniref:LytR/AlgR family response regulator transcription factor n=1 Tax=Foetidibacter luteolus TaxID=2608880 RepID=UPI00129A6E78|nr:LytTR family DNA-binding domain-containing protein [Foetidibacter luteolus]